MAICLPMTDSLSPYPSLCIGQTFSSIEDGRAAVLNDIVSCGQSYKVALSNPKKWYAVCCFKEESGCNFQIRITHIKTSDKIELRKLKPHTCDPSLHFGWKLANSAKLVAHRHNDVIRSDFRIKSAQIQNIERVHHSNQIPYKQAWRARKQVRDDALSNNTSSFQRIYPLLQAISVLNSPSVVVEEGLY
jgi:hypothetical protein